MHVSVGLLPGKGNSWRMYGIRERILRSTRLLGKSEREDLVLAERKGLDEERQVK